MFAQRLRREELRIYRERLVDLMKRTSSIPFVQRASRGCEVRLQSLPAFVHVLPRCKTDSLSLRPRWKKPLFDAGNDNVVWIHHFGEVYLCDFRQEFVRVERRETVIGVNPVH